MSLPGNGEFDGDAVVGKVVWEVAIVGVKVKVFVGVMDG